MSVLIGPEKSPRTFHLPRQSFFWDHHSNAFVSAPPWSLCELF